MPEFKSNERTFQGVLLTAFNKIIIYLGYCFSLVFAEVDEVLKLQPKNVIALDKFFVGNDQLKINTVLLMKDANIEFRTGKNWEN
ncbi:MAG: hypothetical protein Q8N03_01120 [Ignavibacteria bacterium]|nr:hypothetical protein [Ignavibacteria bacterium]